MQSAKRTSHSILIALWSGLANLGSIDPSYLEIPRVASQFPASVQWGPFHNLRLEKKVASALDSRLRGQMTDGDLPNQSDVQMLLCTSYRSPYTCGMLPERETIAHVPSSNRWLCSDSTAPTEYIFYSSIFSRERKVNSWATPDSCRGAVLPLLDWFIPHTECNVNETL